MTPTATIDECADRARKGRCLACGHPLRGAPTLPSLCAICGREAGNRAMLGRVRGAAVSEGR